MNVNKSRGTDGDVTTYDIMANIQTLKLSDPIIRQIFLEMSENKIYSLIFLI